MTDLAGAVAGYVQGSGDSGMRVGVVTRYTSGSATVRISGSDVLVQAARIDSYQPFLGDNVVVMRQGANWIILGASSAIPADNTVQNASFEQGGAVVGTPPNWVATKTGTLTSAYSVTGGTQCSLCPDGLLVLGVRVDTSSAAPIANSQDVFSSAPVPVVQGQVWALNAYTVSNFAASKPLDGIVVQTAVTIQGYANNTDVYPTGATFLAGSGDNSTPFGCPWIRKQAFRIDPDTSEVGGAVIPSGITYIRATLTSTVIYNGGAAVTGTSDVLWDRVVLLQLA